MMIHRTILLALLLMTIGVGCASEKQPMHTHYDVYLLAGQSNADGRGKAADLLGELEKFRQPQPDVLIAYSNSTLRGPYSTAGFVPLAPGFSVPPGSSKTSFHLPGNTFGPELSFGRALADAHPRRHVALIKFTEGGTSLHKDWNPDTRGLLYDQCIAIVRAQLESIHNRGDTYTLAGLAWHQGESDASLATDQYESLLANLITRFRADLDSPELPVVIGEVFDNGHRDGVRAAQRAAAETIPHVFFASCAGLKTSDNGTHFDAPSQIELGRRMAEALLTRRSVTTQPTARK